MTVFHPSSVSEGAGQFRFGYQRALKDVSERSLRDAIQEAFRDVFNQPPDQVSKVLAWTANTYVLTKVLNLDPECRALEREMLSKCRLYMDTNVLLACLLRSHPKYKEVSRVLDVCRGMSVGLRYTQRTYDELMRVIDRSGELYRENAVTRPPSMGFHEHDVIKTYLQEYKVAGVSWGEYHLMLKRSHGRLEKQYGITLDNSDFGSLVPDQETVAFAPIVCQCSSSWHVKSDEVAAHDAFHIILMEKLRAADGELTFGSPWFLTLDYTLEGAEFIRRPHRGMGEYTSSITCDLWTQVLLPFLSPEVPEENLTEAFASLAGSHFFPVARTISVGDLIRHIAPYLQDPFLSPSDIAWILQHDHLRQILKKAENEGVEPPMETLATTVASLIDQRKDLKLTELSKQVEELDINLREAKSSLGLEVERQTSALRRLFDNEMRTESKRWQSMFQAVAVREQTLDLVSDLVLVIILAALFVIIGYLAWASTSNVAVVVALLALGFGVGGAVLSLLRRYRKARRFRTTRFPSANRRE